LGAGICAQVALVARIRNPTRVRAHRGAAP
jgi:hypothetical protein